MAAVIFTEKCMEIKPVKELWKIKARVTRVRDAILLGSGQQMSLDMIHIVYYHYNALRLLPIYMLMMIKKRGAKMHGFINKAYMEKFKPLIRR